MPQLMPLYWVFYLPTFMMLIFMMKSVYSIYSMEEKKLSENNKKFSKYLWFW